MKGNFYGKRKDGAPKKPYPQRAMDHRFNDDISMGAVYAGPPMDEPDIRLNKAPVTMMVYAGPDMQSGRTVLPPKGVEIIKCPVCGSNNSSLGKFCTECGNSLSKTV